MILCLDYDDCTEGFLWKELLRLREIYKGTLQVWETSPGSYHVRSSGNIDNEKAWEVMHESACSSDYKEMCYRHKLMPFRLSSKKVFDEKGLREIPPPRMLFEI